MHDLSDVTRLPEDFDGRVRLFPLPELVLFPHAMQPLHIFEPRYCEMLLESLSSDRLIAMATLSGGMGQAGAVSPPIAPIVCIGRIVSHARVEGDRHNILLVGTKRARLRRELDAGRTFRMAEVDVIDDIYPASGTAGRDGLKRELLDAFGEIVPAAPNVQQNLHELMAGQMGLGPITDIIAYTLPFETADKLELLGEANVDDRARALVRLLKSGAIELHSVTVDKEAVEPGSTPPGEDEGPRFPPPFSVN